MKYHKDNLTFKLISSNPAKNTVTLRPTFGTLIKINIAAAALVAVSVVWTRMLLEEPVTIPMDNTTPNKET